MMNLYNIGLSITFIHSEKPLDIRIKNNYKCLPTEIDKYVQCISRDMAQYIDGNRLEFVSLSNNVELIPAIIVNTKEIKYIKCFYNIVKENVNDDEAAEGKTHVN